MKQLLEAGVHFGHQTRRWNPKMKPYIFIERNGIYIIDLQKTVRMIEEAYDFLRSIAMDNGRILFVGTKKQAQEAVENEAKRCGEFYVNQRWLGGTLTNFVTIRKRIERLLELEEWENTGYLDQLPKKENAILLKEKERLEKHFNGIKGMQKLPDALFVVDPRKERIATLEARHWYSGSSHCRYKLRPRGSRLCYPRDDDAIHVPVRTICSKMSDAILEGKQGVRCKRSDKCG